MFLYLSLGSATMQCYGADRPPLAGGNPFTEFVSQQLIPNINHKQETPVQITEIPTKTVTLKQAEISSYLQNNKYTDKATADKIQNLMKFSSKISTSYNVFDCNDMSKNFFNLPKDQQTEGNFWNKIITRSALLVKGTKEGDSVTFQLKKVTGTMKKRWSKVIPKLLMNSYTCTVTDQECGYKDSQDYRCEQVTTQQYQCNTVPVSSYQCTGFGADMNCGFVTNMETQCGFVPVQSTQCGYHPSKVYQCVPKSYQQSFSDPYNVYSIIFRNDFNSTEVTDMFNSVQRQMANRIKF